MTSWRIVYTLVVALAVVRAAPAPAPAPGPAPAPSNDDQPEIIEIIAPAASAQETLDSLNLGEPGSELSERNKRTIGILRQLFPTLTQLVEQKIQNFTSMLFQTFGPLLLGSLGGVGGGGTSQGSGTVTFDDEDDDDDDVETASGGEAKVSVELPVFTPPDVESVPVDSSSPRKLLAEDKKPSEEYKAGQNSEESLKTSNKSESQAFSSNTSDSSTTDVSSTDPSDIDNETQDTSKSRRTRCVGNGAAEENQLLSGAESQQQEVRVQFADGANKDQQTAASEDQETAAQTNSGQIDEISLEDGDNSEENRNKRFLNFGFGGGAQAGAGGGGGSGNFLFDIVRLVAGSSATEPAEDGGEAAGAVDAAGTGKGDNLTEGVPGPITRLFIIANRGVANLIQDLILRLAQTSERIVNFKARLITSII